MDLLLLDSLTVDNRKIDKIIVISNTWKMRIMQGSDGVGVWLEGGKGSEGKTGGRI